MFQSTARLLLSHSTEIAGTDPINPSPLIQVMLEDSHFLSQGHQEITTPFSLKFFPPQLHISLLFSLISLKLPPQSLGQILPFTTYAWNPWGAVLSLFSLYPLSLGSLIYLHGFTQKLLTPQSLSLA